MGRTDMLKPGDVLRLSEGGTLTQREISTITGVSTGTVSNILARAATAGVSWPLPDGVAIEDLRGLLYPPVETAKADYLEPDLATVAQVLMDQKTRRGYRAPRVTRDVLWEEYCAEAKAQGLKGYSRSHFFGRLKEHLKGPGQEPEMRFHYEPGVWMMSDFSGKTLPLQTRDGHKMVEILVCVLPCSGLIFATAVADQTLASWTGAHRAAFEYYGGVASRLVCDNLRSAVTKWSEGDAVLNKTFADFARCYGIAVLPARRVKPRDKGAVESSVRAVQSRVLLRLRNDRFFDMQTLNAALKARVDKLNAEEMPAWGASRRARFATTDGLALQPLPEQPWSYVEYSERKVGPNYHVTLEYNLYSVPKQWIGHDVVLKTSAKIVEISLKDTGEVVTRHPRRFGRGAYETIAGHMPSQHAAMKQQRSTDYEIWMMEQLRAVGPMTAAWSARCRASRDFPEQAYRTLRGVVRMVEQHSPARIEEACTAALAAERFTAGFVKDQLNAPSPASGTPQEEVLPEHEHIRGSSYYRSDGEGGS